MPEKVEGSDERQIHSWKEIAAYLKRDVRTVIRWEKSEGLPVHRHLHQARSSVYAYLSEIDAWALTRKPRDKEVARWRRPLPALVFAGVLMLSLLLVADAPFSAHASAAQGAGNPVERRLLSQRDMDLNNFFFLRPSPDGQRIAYSAIGTREGALYVRELDSGQSKKLTTGEFTLSPVWSPDGTRIAYALTAAANPAPALKLFDLRSDTSSELVKIESTELMPLDWSRDGSQLLCTVTHPDRTSSLALVSVSSGDLTTLLSQGWNSSSSASFSPDGRFIAFSAVENDNRDIFILAVDGSRKQRITQDSAADVIPLWSPDGDAILYQRDDGIWASRIADGQPQGQPRLVRSKRLDQPLSWTSAGGLFYVMYNYVAGEYALPVNSEPGKPTGFAQRLDINLDQVDRFAWSPNMNWIALSRVGDGRIYLYSTSERSLRTLPTGMEQYPSSLWWSGDSKSIFFTPYQAGVTVFAMNPADGSVRQLFAKTNDTERFNITADGTRMLFLRGKRAEGRRQLVVSALGDPNGRVVSSEHDSSDAFSNWVRPAFSPDAKQILFGRASVLEDTLWVIDVDGSNPHKLASVTHDAQSSSGAFLHYAAWSPDGLHVAYDGARTLFTVDVKSGEKQEMVLPQEFRELGVMQWSPDGKSIGFRSRVSNFELWQADNLLPSAAK